MTPAVIDPERQFLGCLMQLPTTPARHLLTGMRATDLADPIAADLLQLAIELVVADRAPTPLALFDGLCETTDTQSCAGGSRRLQIAGAWITDTYQHAPTLPTVTGGWLKTIVLKAAWRRAVHTHGLRLVQAVNDQWSTTALYDATDDTTQVDDLWTRYLTACDQAGLAREAA